MAMADGQVYAAIPTERDGEGEWHVRRSIRFRLSIKEMVVELVWYPEKRIFMVPIPRRTQPVITTQ